MKQRTAQKFRRIDLCTKPFIVTVTEIGDFDGMIVDTALDMMTVVFHDAVFIGMGDIAYFLCKLPA